MGLLDRLKGKKIVDWSNAFRAAPKFYEKPDVSPFGVIVLTEETETILPKAPHERYRVDGNVVTEWKLVLFSISKDSIIGTVDYSTALKKAEKYALDSDKDFILVKGLSFAELEGLKE